jgi:rare lipoprotein A
MTQNTGDTAKERIEGFSVSPYPRVFSLLLAVLLLASCASIDSERYSEPYDDSGYAVASWYGRELHGKRTSSGQPFNMHAFTCAHRTYPFGTKLKITNPANGKTVHCVVNDRGPTSKDRDIDLSYAAAKKIGLTGKGAAKVRIEYSGTDQSSPED